MIQQLCFFDGYFSTDFSDEIEKVCFGDPPFKSREHSLQIDIFGVNVKAQVAHDEVDLGVTLLLTLKVLFVSSFKERM